MSKFKEIIDLAAKFIEKQKGEWDHIAWNDFVHNVQKRGIEITDDLKRYLGGVLESAKNFYTNLPITSNAKETTNGGTEQNAVTAPPTAAKEEEENIAPAHTTPQSEDKPIEETANSKETISAVETITALEGNTANLAVDTPEAAPSQAPSEQDTENTPSSHQETPSEAANSSSACETESSQDQTVCDCQQSHDDADNKKNKRQPILSERLTKKILMSLQEGSFLISNATDENNNPMLAIEIPHLDQREDVWKKMQELKINQKTCYVYNNKEEYEQTLK
ncbi:hypothetical protein MCHI_003557 [Candidatus Magnetoovum chiemensis]|nr:hypothetical protein MCHI_003557 [Candidatus Magnetoovum chiemensis]